MKTNVLKALVNLDKTKRSSIMQVYTNKNRINNMGDSLEYYIKDLFCNSFEIEDIAEKDKEYSKYMSYLGNASNPPDLMIDDGDAIEVKKIESQGSRIALNSSYPKDKLYVDNSRITKACRKAEEDWEEKDLIYAIGVVKEKELRLLWLIHGECYAASKEVYKKIVKEIKGAVHTAGYDFTETNELGKVKNVDPLGLTSLRVRGMWHIDNPLKAFDYLDVEFDKNADLTVYSVMTKEKYNSFPENDKEELEDSELEVNDVEIKSPNNPAEYIPAKFIKKVYKNL